MGSALGALRLGIPEYRTFLTAAPYPWMLIDLLTFVDFPKEQENHNQYSIEESPKRYHANKS